MQQNDLIERLRALYVWPQSVADHHADTLTPRQIERLYAVGIVANEAADALAQRDADIARLREALALARNRLQRCTVDYPTGSRQFIEVGEWADEATQALGATDAA